MRITCVFSLSTYYSGFPDGTIVKNLPAMQETQETQVWSLDWEDPWRGKWQPIPVFCPGKFHGNRILVGTCPRVCKIVGHLERLSTHIKICITLVSNVSNSLWPCGLWPIRLLCSWGFQARIPNGVGCHVLL